jgi:aminopeptidase N
MSRSILFIFILVSTIVGAQHQDKVDFVHGEIFIEPAPREKLIKGTVTYKFDVLSGVDSIFLDAQHIEFTNVKLNGRKTKFSNNGETIFIYKNFKKGKAYSLTLEYTATPKQTVYFIGWDDNIPNNNQVWTQGQGKYTSHWLPSFDDMEEKVEYDLSIAFDSNYEVIANGKPQKIEEDNGLTTWSFDMQQPMSSYLLAFAIGDYDKQELVSSSGVPIENYFYPKDSLKVEPTYRYTKEIFDFLETEIGVPYPWQNYKQLPVRDFLYAGMENTGATIFSDGYMVDSTAFVDKNYVNVNAHEMAHQWFGNQVTEKDGNHHWLHEGFATYYAYLAEKELFGDEHFFWKLYDSAKQLNKLSKESKGEALTNPKASSLTFYEKGAWALHILRSEIGDIAFKKGVKSYLEKFKFKNVTIQDFLNEMELASGTKLSPFSALWLNTAEFPFELAKENLISNSRPLKEFLKLKWELTTSLAEKNIIIKRYWEGSNSHDLKARILMNYHKRLSADFLKIAFNSQSIRIRQALATIFDKVPNAFKSYYETLLDDKSYVTIENALYRLWISFPQERLMYLERTKDISGLPNKNVRLLWLLFAVLTKDYGTDELREEYISELFEYTSPEHAMEVRQGAFGLIGDVFKFSDENILDLLHASVHHSWQFRKFARTLLDDLLKDDKQKKRVIALSKGLKGDKIRYINSKLKE